MQAVQLEKELTILKQKIPNLERKASDGEEVVSLREQLHEEKLQKMLKEQALANLEDKVSGLTERQLSLEALLREKQGALQDSESLIREQKTKAQRSKDKVQLGETTVTACMDIIVQ